MNEPRFPQDVERIIFEFASLGHNNRPDRRSVVSLLLVARRVHEWILPSLYRTLMMIGATPRPAWFAELENPVFPDTPSLLINVGRYLHHCLLAIANDKGTGKIQAAYTTIFKYSPNLRTFTLWFGETYAKPVDIISCLNRSGIQLTHLAAPLQGLNEGVFKSDALRSIKHLEVTNLEGTWEHWKKLRHLPRLTHLQISQSVEPQILMKLLSTTDGFNLRILISSILTNAFETPRDQYTSIIDPRLVLIISYDWIQSLADWRSRAESGGVDCWIFAERICEARTRGLFTRGLNEQRWVTRGMRWMEELSDEGKKWYNELSWI